MNIKKYEPHVYFVFRVLVGLLFAQHGAQKLFGLFGGQKATLLSTMGVAGVIELFGGILLAVGLITRIAAFLSAAVMIAAYFTAHASKGLLPIVNKGELALLYLACFLVLFFQGAKKWGLDNLFKKE